MKKSCLGSLILMLITSSLVLGSAGNLAKAQSGVNVSTVISEDTTWTLANSPYDITGNVLVNSGATLTLSAGLHIKPERLHCGNWLTNSSARSYNNIVNASGYIQVDGSLFAVGTSSEPIQIIGTTGTYTMGLISGTFYPSITFSRGSTGWNPQTSSGSTIQNTVLSSVIFSVSSSVELKRHFQQWIIAKGQLSRSHKLQN